MEDPRGWIFIRFVSERAVVKSKMLYSSTSNPLKMALGMASFQWSLSGVEKDQMTLKEFVDDNMATLSEGAKVVLKPILDEISAHLTQEERERQSEQRQRWDYENDYLSKDEIIKKEEDRQEVHTGGSSSLSFPVDSELPSQLGKFISGENNFIELV